MSPDALAARLARAWSSRTASLWSAENPARGQCSVTSIAVHDLLGGEILKTDVDGAWHFYNLLGGERRDFTASQFPAPIAYRDLPSSREEALADTSEAQLAALRKALDGAA